MQYRLFLASLFVLIIFAYIDTTSIMQSFNDKNLFKKYETSTKFIGIGVKNDDSNVKIIDVVDNSPAYKAGLFNGYIILRVDNKKILSAEELKKNIEQFPENKKISLTFLNPQIKGLETLSLLPDIVQH